jgi:hypothetical protein
LEADKMQMEAEDFMKMSRRQCIENTLEATYNGIKTCNAHVTIVLSINNYNIHRSVSNVTKASYFANPKTINYKNENKNS